MYVRGSNEDNNLRVFLQGICRWGGPGTRADLPRLCPFSFGSRCNAKTARQSGGGAAEMPDLL